MRELKKIYIIKKDAEEFQKLMKEALDNNLYYPPHHYAFSIKEQNYELNVSRGRPLYLNNGLVRVSNISDTSIGIILLYNKNSKDFKSFGEQYYKNLATYLKVMAFDYDIKFQDPDSFITSMIEEEKVDTNKIFQYVLYSEQNEFKTLKG